LKEDIHCDLFVKTDTLDDLISISWISLIPQPVPLSWLSLILP